MKLGLKFLRLEKSLISIFRYLERQFHTLFISYKKKELQNKQKRKRAGGGDKPRFILYIVIEWILLIDVGVILVLYLLKGLKVF